MDEYGFLQTVATTSKAPFKKSDSVVMIMYSQSSKNIRTVVIMACAHCCLY